MLKSLTFAHLICILSIFPDDSSCLLFINTVINSWSSKSPFQKDIIWKVTSKFYNYTQGWVSFVVSTINFIFSKKKKKETDESLGEDFTTLFSSLGEYATGEINLLFLVVCNKRNWSLWYHIDKRKLKKVKKISIPLWSYRIFALVGTHIWTNEYWLESAGSKPLYLHEL